VNHPTLIKICGLTREADVDAAVAAGADFIGFVLYDKSPRHVSRDRAIELAKRLPDHVTPVALLVNVDATELIAANAHFDWANQRFLLQFHGNETPEQCAQARLPWWRAARVPVDRPQDFDLVKFAQDFKAAQAILVDAYSEGFGGSGKTFDWTAIPWSHPALSVDSRVVLSGGLTPANVGDGILQARPWAVDVSSGVEAVDTGGKTLKGIKDPEKIIQFVEAVRATDRVLNERFAKHPS
jgi:phosphoribosylanthranilate isomerase